MLHICQAHVRFVFQVFVYVFSLWKLENFLCFDCNFQVILTTAFGLFMFAVE